MERTLAVESGPATSAGQPAVELRGLRRDFGDRTALAGISARLEPGESLAVLGRNGSGKSTLLRILAGLLRPSGGEISVLGFSLPKETHRIRGRVGYLGHSPLLYRDLSPRENLSLVAALHGLDPEDAGRRIDVEDRVARDRIGGGGSRRCSRRSACPPAAATALPSSRRE